MRKPYKRIIIFVSEVKEFFVELAKFLTQIFHLQFIRFESGKGVFVAALYRQRGKQARRLVHSGMATIAALGVAIAPVVAQEFPGRSVDPWELTSQATVLSATISDQDTATVISDKPRGEILEYVVADGDTVSTIAEKFGVDSDTVRWQNDLSGNDKIKAGQMLQVLPVTGISHKVKKGDTVYSIAKKYDTAAQAVVDFPYNTFANDETFELAIGQIIVVPDGVLPNQISTSPRIKRLTPNAGTVVASGQFVWPVGGQLSQRFAWYHKGLDIANRGAPNVLAADAGTVVGAGWLDGYGYGIRVIIDHGNGFRTLYAHLSSVNVRAGQTVNRGDVVGRMGSTGRSTGTHLHFEVIKNGAYLNPLSVLQ